MTDGGWIMLKKEFFIRDARIVAQELLGKILVFRNHGEIMKAYITETEAYLGVEDKASKAYRGKKTKGNAPMFLEGGHAYVYMTYGMHFLFNVVTGEKDDPQAVLIRGVEMIQGIKIASQNRFGLNDDRLTEKQRRRISDGPGKFTKAYGLNKEQNGCMLIEGNLYFEEGSPIKKIYASKRIGIDYAEEAKEFLWRYTSFPV